MHPRAASSATPPNNATERAKEDGGAGRASEVGTGGWVMATSPSAVIDCLIDANILVVIVFD
jgi:hypothetical protein